MTTATTRDRVLVGDEYRIVSCADRDRRTALTLLPQAKQLILNNVEFKSTGRGPNRCTSWGEYLYKLASNVHRGRGKFRSNPRNQPLAGFELSEQELKDLVLELEFVIGNREHAHRVVCQMLINGF